MATDVEILARLITNQVLTIDAGAGRNIGDLTNNDASGSIYSSWLKICEPLVPWINTHGSGSSGSGSVLWGNISGSINDQLDLIVLFNTKQNSLGYTPENVASKSVDTNLGTSNTLYPSQNAVKVYVDTNKGESNTASNLGTGVGIFNQKSGVDLQFKSLVAGTNVTISSGSTEITINASGGISQVLWGQISGSISDQTDLYNLYTTLSGSISTEVLNRTNADTSLQSQITSVSGSLSDKENISNKSTSTTLGTSDTLYPSQNAVKVYIDTQILASSSVSTTASNLGTGSAIFAQKVGNDLQFKSLLGGRFINISSGSNEITINSTAEQLTGLIFTNETIFNNAATSYIYSDTLDSTHFVVSYQDTGNGASGSAIIGTFSNSTISFGSEYVFENSNTAYPFVTTLDTSTIVISYQDSSNVNKSVVGTISGSVITFGSVSVFNNNGGFPLSALKLNSSQFLVNYTDTGDVNKGKSKIGTVSGSTIVFGSEYIFSSNNIVSNISSLLDTDKFVICYKDQSTSNYGKSVVGTISGSVITFGSASIFASETMTTIGGISSVDIDTSTFVVIYRNQAQTQGISKIGSVSGSTITFGSEYVFNEGDVNYLTSTKLLTNKFIIGYQRGVSPNVTGSIIQGEKIGNTLVYSYPNTFYETSSALTAFLSPAILDSNIIINYKDLSDNKGKTKTGVESSNITALNIGTGEGEIFKKRDGAALEFKTIKAGSNITVTNNVDDITINSTASSSISTGSNLGSGEGLYTTNTGSVLQFKSLVAGSNISLTSDSNSITINASSSVSNSNYVLLEYDWTTNSTSYINVPSMSLPVTANTSYLLTGNLNINGAVGGPGSSSLQIIMPSGSLAYGCYFNRQGTSTVNQSMFTGALSPLFDVTYSYFLSMFNIIIKTGLASGSLIYQVKHTSGASGSYTTVWTGNSLILREL